MTILGIVLILLAMGAGLYAVGRVPGSRNWGLGGLTAILGLVGLLVAARSGVDRPVGYYGGLISFAIGVLIVFYLVKLAFDEAEKREHGPTEASALERWRSRPDIEVRRTTKHVVALALIVVVLGTVVFHFLSPWWWTPIASNWGYVDDTILITFWITGFVFVAVGLFMAFCVFRYRHQKGRRAAYEPENKKLELWLTIGTTVGVAGMLAPGLFVWHQFITVPEDAFEVEAVGQQWRWTFRLPGEDGVLGTTDPRSISYDNPFGMNADDPHGQDDILIESSELYLQVDRPVKLLLRSIDVLHNFTVPQFRGKMDMVPGMITYFWLTPTRTGTFEILCFELCGVGHYAMRGTVVVAEEEDYQAWLQEQSTFEEMLARAGSGGEAEVELALDEGETDSTELD
ncbi:MAG: cytochrome c oxidase subunit II [Kiloniellales bacterium]